MNDVTLEEFQHMNLNHVHALAVAFLQKTQDQQGQLHQKRKAKRHKRAWTRVQNLADSMLKFLNSFSGIVDIAKGVDKRFGPIAYGILAVVLTLASNMKRHDELITTMLSKFGKLVSRLEMVGRLESSNPNVCDLVLQIYVQIVALFRATAKYYSQTSFGRMLQAITKPPKEYMQQRQIEVNESVSDLIQELIVLLFTATKDILRLIQAEADEDNLSRVRDVARVFGHSEESLAATNILLESKKLYSNCLSKMSSRKESRPKLQQLQQVNREMLLERRQYQDWDRHPSSCLLLLGGDNARRYDVSSPCWLSPMAPQLYSSIVTVANSRAVLCSLVLFDHQECRTLAALLRLALKSMMWQLLNEDPLLISRHSSRIKEAWLSKSNSSGGDTEEVHETLFELFKEFFYP